LIHCERITDFALALKSLQDHWPDISEDNTQLRIPDVVNEFWVGVWDDGKYKGCFRLGAVTSVLYEVHICIGRGQILAYCHAFFRWCLDNTDLRKMVCNVPEFKKGAISTALRMGFSRQGINTDSFQKRGALHALVQLGITRKQMEDLCQQQSRC
jgi:hypothetical protein